NPDNPDAWLARHIYRKMLLREKKKTSATLEQANADLDKALTIGKADPSKESVNVILYAGEMASERNDAAAALSYFKRATELRPSDHRGWVRWGQIVAVRGTDESRREAVKIWSRALEHVPVQEMDLILPLAAMLIDLK